MLYFDKFFQQPIIPQNATIVYGACEKKISISFVILIIVMIIMIIYSKYEPFQVITPRVPYNDYENTFAPYSYSDKR